MHEEKLIRMKEVTKQVCHNLNEVVDALARDIDYERASEPTTLHLAKSALLLALKESEVEETVGAQQHEDSMRAKDATIKALYVNLASSNAKVRSLQDQNVTLLKALMGCFAVPLSLEVEDLIRSGKQITAITTFRKQYNILGLKEAKDYIEALALKMGYGFQQVV
jgi:ribosomal protein L7/L12